MTQRWKNRPNGSNWGEFGPDDQKGRLNLLTPQRVVRAVKEVETGERFCLSLPLDYADGFLTLVVFLHGYSRQKGED